MKNKVIIEELTEVSEAFFNDIKELLSQLTSSKIDFSIEDFKRIIFSDHSIFLAAFNNETRDKIIGVLTLAIVDIPTGIIARIEDVVVDQNAREQGIGKKITFIAIQKAKEMGVKKIDLTSNPKREAANRLYEKLGFQKRETNVYRYEI